MINFPDLERESTLELPAVALISGCLGLIILSFSKVLGLIVWVPCVLIFLNSTRISIANTITRYRWAHGFKKRLSNRKLQSLIQDEPERYILHVRYFGGFDAYRLTPAAVLEDQSDTELMAIYPSSWKVIKTCEQAGVPIRK